MKQKTKKSKTNNSSGGIIRTIFRQELENFEKSVDKKFISFETNMDIKLENLERGVDTKARQYHDEILTSNDKLAKKFEAVQQDLELGNLQMRRQVEDHEERITTLESSQKI